MKTVAGLVLALGCVSCLAAADDPKGTDLALKARAVLERNCSRCHRGPGSAAEFDVRSVQSLIDTGVIEPGKPEDSLLWTLTHRGTMPPRGQLQLPRPTPEDAQVISDWIKAGAPAFPEAKPRTFIPLQASLQAVHDDLKKLRDPSVRGRQRYFSLAEWHNNPAIRDETLQLARAALAKTLNSLSWERELVLPRAVDAAQTVFAVDIDKLGWKREHWRAVRARYPYAVGFDNLPDTSLRDLDADIRDLARNSEPLYLVRADWFISTATQPALYHALLFDLSLPELTHRMADAGQPANPRRMTARDLEAFLGVDVLANIRRGEDHAMRCGFTPSGVSGQNRMIERHRTRFGAYWKSYDFKADNRRAILSQFPLGPVFEGNPFPQLAFEHDGGEIIFHLPNGLQGYMLIDGKDNRIDAGPIEVVSDALKTSGTPAIVNGLSCIACHKQGMIDPPADEILQFSRAVGDEREQVRRLYPKDEVFVEKVNADRKQFLNALDAVIGRTLRQGADADRDLADFPEPVSEVARIYILEELDLATVAAELHERDATRLRARLEGDDLLQSLGLAVLLTEGGKIKRAFWEGAQGGPTVMQLSAFSLDYTALQFRE